MSSSVPLEIASTIQSASIKRDPSPNHDINPSTAASSKVPVSVHPDYAYDDKDSIDGGEEEIEDIPYDVIRPLPRRASFPPIPDLRFEQSYLASIAHADSYWKVAFITIRDQVISPFLAIASSPLCMPLIQGIAVTLLWAGWKHWNKNTKLSGNNAGARVHRWWYTVNNWPIKERIAEIGKNAKLAAEMGDFYENQASAGD
ncbi:hypothetical protein SBOR_4624 [Sclerotinia borealis F-4128]|uniref:DUF1770-domain-containing protein n=1 Tax=Sclerotinia borealis (strain F-4128) TaxID=1432307 RepID=W9CK05_SCLBF|nr:hypothetical protein SBOR_4624 [Sclerotinia borealis F-4128]